MTGNEKWIYYSNPKHGRSWGKPSCASTSAAKPNIHGSKLLLYNWWDQLGVVYYELLKLTKTIMEDCYQLRLMHLSRALKKKWPLYKQRHDKVILQHDNARPHVAKWMKTYLETLKWEVLPHKTLLHLIITCPFQWDMTWMSSTFILMEMTKKWVDIW